MNPDSFRTARCNAQVVARPTRRAICLALSLSLATVGADVVAASSAQAATRAVTSCVDDAGSGSLRSVIASAVSGDTIDLSGLTCSEITLELGQIPIMVDTLALQGPVAHSLAIRATGQPNRVLYQNPGTSLAISDLTISGSNFNYSGGCILVAGSLLLTRSTVTDCHARDVGGAVAVGGNLSMSYSTISDSSVDLSVGANTGGYGGGAYVVGNLLAKYSTFRNNSAFLDGGGFVAAGSVSINGTTISGNHADRSGGFVAGLVNAGANTALIRNSTISGNVAQHDVGGANVLGWSLEVQNSTITDNHAADFGSSSAAGLMTSVTHGLDVQSTILFGNGSPEGAPSDFNAVANFGVTGSNNIIGTAFLSVALPGTITADPKLRPLSSNGGPTLTHAIPADSPAHDAGNNAPNLATDQRGLPRTQGAATDIGAYELQADLIFADGFD